MAQKQFIGLSQLWYGEVIATAPLTGAALAAYLQAAATKEVTNVHDDTWGYEESDPEVTEYINQLSGLPYYRDKVSQAAPSVAFTLGEYQFADLAALIGGTATDTSWARPDSVDFIEKGVVAKTKTGNYIVFPRANIIAKGNYVERNLGLGVTAFALETGVEGLASQYMFDGSVVVSPTKQAERPLAQPVPKPEERK
jgi:hypothetical protein